VSDLRDACDALDAAVVRLRGAMAAASEEEIRALAMGPRAHRCHQARRHLKVEAKRRADIARGMCPGCGHYFICFDTPECQAARAAKVSQ
jgi:hypothetical protein